MNYIFEYNCPHCGTEYVGSIEPPTKDFKEEKTCEDCEKKFTLDVFIDIFVETYETK